MQTWIERARLMLAALPGPLRAWIRKLLPKNESQHLFALTLVVGVVCGLVAVAFHLALRATEKLLIERALRAPGWSWMVWTVLTPTLGGLAAGAALTWLVPGARGSGIPQVKQAFAIEGGRIRFRDAFGKFILAVLQIGSGASLGREGPTVQICAGAASTLARATSLPPRNMRRLTPVGVAAGIAAAFNAPIAAVTFTIEEIVGALDHTVLSGVVVAAALAAVIERSILGVHPVIEVAQSYGLDHPSSLSLFALLGGAAAIVSVVFTDSLLQLRLRFRTLEIIPRWTQPAVGGMVTGLLAVVALHFLGTNGVTGGGYETLGRALAGQLGIKVLLALAAIKIVATTFSYSSGGAGGIFAPSLFIGAMLGGAVGYVDVHLFNHEGRQLGAFALVGMGAVFAGVIRAPITSVLIIFEMTGSYGLVLPLMLANMTAYGLARRWRPIPIYEALLAQDGIVLPHATAPTHAIEQLRVADAMTTELVVAHAEQTVAEALVLVADVSFSCLPVVESGVVLGVVPVADLRAAALTPRSPLRGLIRPAALIESDAPLLRAVVHMNDRGVRQLLVRSAAPEGKLIGVLAMSDLVRVHDREWTTARTSDTDERPTPELRACMLMSSVVVVDGASRVAQLAATLADAGATALLIRDGLDKYWVLLPEHLVEFARDEELQKMLIAADLARPCPAVDEGADLFALARVMASTGASAVGVRDAATRLPLGIVTRSTAALALLDWYASHSAPPPAHTHPAPSPPSPSP